ncbi:rhomboid family intramembrane serine protease [Aureibacter tunicatorum]|uniref:Membrane associated rhomboid family serine protease n=1 Tax=Aureibacter tunicatorum TaxID=866807 RepID=A0AAE3XJ21_9BACT|nr:rhomboid family intramembrane serine protease [Aureibacter tunicatorum]MDR6238656.1 membrane associated rhomboid family serine protease [Aureibacter tunicatorum]BDD05413.1 hypothetical protein AUTU_28960 [Aureibacter tunicatorum]
MKVTYNSPVVLTYAFLSVIVMILGYMTGFRSMSYFMVGSHMDFLNPLDYFRLFSHVLGHSNWSHLLGNFTFILLLGPLLEEKYGSKQLLVMILFTALITGILNILLFDHGLLGASGIVFMMILLSSIVNAQEHTIPLTFILVAVLFLGKEVFDIFKNDQVSQFAHIIGGVCGAVFGFFALKKRVF